jgi:hypothetical protein
MYLVSELEPFVKSRITMFVRAPLEPRKAIGLGVISICTWG